MWSSVPRDEVPAEVLAERPPAPRKRTLARKQYDYERHLARWGNPLGCGAPGNSFCEPSVGGVSACPCANAPSGSGRGCDNSGRWGWAMP